MKETEANEVIGCLPAGKTLFRYFKDRYAAMLLSYFVRDGKSIREVKASKFGRLLDRPLIKDLVAEVGSGALTPDSLAPIWPEDSECYLLTLGKWGGTSRYWDQTSRPGTNLVLQLNFSTKHNRPYHVMMKPQEGNVFENDEHPIAGRGLHTMAWARLDVDLRSGEALIEEVQSDWVKHAVYRKALIEKAGDDPRVREKIARSFWFRGFETEADSLYTYLTEVLPIHIAMWDEATLAATIWFLKEELGLRHIYHHTFATGNALKRLTETTPPRSLYTALPRRFCFEQVETAPAFLTEDKTRHVRSVIQSGEARFWLLEL